MEFKFIHAVHYCGHSANPNSYSKDREGVTFPVWEDNDRYEIFVPWSNIASAVVTRHYSVPDGWYPGEGPEDD